MDVTSFRRRNHHPQPLTVFRELYYDYANRSKSIPNQPIFALQDKKTTNSAEKMTMYLKRTLKGRIFKSKHLNQLENKDISQISFNQTTCATSPPIMKLSLAKISSIKKLIPPLKMESNLRREIRESNGGMSLNSHRTNFCIKCPKNVLVGTFR